MRAPIDRPDTGWNCCKCGQIARVMSYGNTYCNDHWQKLEEAVAQNDKRKQLLLEELENYE